MTNLDEFGWKKSRLTTPRKSWAIVWHGELSGWVRLFVSPLDLWVWGSGCKKSAFFCVLSLRICLRIAKKNWKCLCVSCFFWLLLTSWSNRWSWDVIYISAIVLEVGDVNFAEAQGAAWLHEIAVRMEIGDCPRRRWAKNKWEALYKHHENHQENCFGTNSATALKVVHQLRATLIAIDVFQVLEIAAMKIPKMFATFFFSTHQNGGSSLRWSHQASPRLVSGSPFSGCITYHSGTRWSWSYDNCQGPKGWRKWVAKKGGIIQLRWIQRVFFFRKKYIYIYIWWNV